MSDADAGRGSDGAGDEQIDPYGGEEFAELSAGPIARHPEVPNRWVVRLGRDERKVVVRILGELRALLTDSDPENATGNLLVARLFPAVYDDAKQEAEYQRLMRDDLLASRVAAIDAVTDVFGKRRDPELTEPQVHALMQSLNAVRLVLGTMLGITDDQSASDADIGETGEHHLYHYLGWLLEWTIRSLRPV